MTPAILSLRLSRRGVAAVALSDETLSWSSDRADFNV